ncbi:MAG: TraY domain-containing protein [Hyphomicrobiaceae bacterium]|nr:TraY domain-containing protein [Hyphomicrobiaceae bacterium]
MAHIVVRDLADEAEQRLRERSARNGRTPEAEARFILEADLAAVGVTCLANSAESATGWVEATRAISPTSELR